MSWYSIRRRCATSSPPSARRRSWSAVTIRSRSAIRSQLKRWKLRSSTRRRSPRSVQETRGAFSPCNDRGEYRADRAPEHRIGHAVVGRGLGIDDHGLRARPARDVESARDRIDLQARAYREEEVGLARRLHRTVDHLGQERLAERDGVALEDAAAVAAVRVFLARAHPLQAALHRPAPP